MFIFVHFITVILLTASLGVSAWAQTRVRPAYIQPLQPIPSINPPVASPSPYGNRYGDIFVLEPNAEAWLEEGEAIICAPADQPIPFEYSEAEKRGKASKAGVWGQTVPHTEAGKYLNQFAVVEGRVHNVSVQDKWVYVNFDENWREDFTLAISHKAATLPGWPEWHALAGKTVRGRGIVNAYYGPRIELFHPRELEILD
ncbi:MAG: hypothetical protein CMM94_05860 [Rickettsiales bacterium]|nr:hypothetical protein [Rickettsiales bacterium]